MEKQLKTVLDYSLRLISIRPRSESEMKRKLEVFSQRKKINMKYVSKVIVLLKEKEFINDNEFTKWWIDQRSTFRPRGKILLAKELYQKGVKKDTVKTALEVISSEKEYKWAQKVFERIEGNLGKYRRTMKKKKIYEYLSRRGFSANIIYRVIDSFMKKE